MEGLTILESPWEAVGLKIVFIDKNLPQYESELVKVAKMHNATHACFSTNSTTGAIFYRK